MAGNARPTFRAKLPMKKIIAGISLLLVATIIILAYMASIIFSEHISYKNGSIEDYLLTPEIIKELPFGKLADASYFYSSADGNKPAINTVEFPTSISDTILLDYFSSNKYESIENGSYKKGSQEITVEYIDSKEKKLKITVLEYWQ